MEKRWKNVLLILLLLIIVVAIYFFLPNFANFSQTAVVNNDSNTSGALDNELITSTPGSLYSVMIAKGLDLKTLPSDFNKLVSVEESKLVGWKSELNSSVNKLVVSEKELVPIYIGFIDVLIKLKDVEEQTTFLAESTSGLCELKEEYVAVNNKMKSIVLDYKNISEKIIALQTNNLAVADAYNLYGLSETVLVIEEDTIAQEEIINSITGDCQ